uniref:BPTI/Kunitz inhibitor domain-containing protein n=1 Tax=Chelydra serpentina TaxID=8475 RepID=A0A8C3SFD9_CHESE
MKNHESWPHCQDPPIFTLSVRRLGSFAYFPLSSSAVNDVCKLPVDAGSCFPYVTRYFYNSVTKKCEAFTYGGCKGNGNRFASIDECLRTCGTTAPLLLLLNGINGYPGGCLFAGLRA